MRQIGRSEGLHEKMLALTDGRKLGKANNARGCHCSVLGSEEAFDYIQIDGAHGYASAAGF
jgi:hypothetical protein